MEFSGPRRARAGVAIGDLVLDLGLLEERVFFASSILARARFLIATPSILFWLSAGPRGAGCAKASGTIGDRDRNAAG